MSNPLPIRSPFAAVPESQAAHYTVLDNFAALDANERPAGRMTVRVDLTKAERKKLQPSFPGALTFKPAAGQTLPTDLSNVGQLVGDLYLTFTTPALLTRLQKVLPQLAYPPTLAYLGVTIGRDFFQDIVLKGAPLGRNAAARLTRPARVHAFASGTLSVLLTPPPTGDVSSFAALGPGPTENTGEVTLLLGSMVPKDFTLENPSLAEMNGADILKPPRFVPLPLAYWYAALMQTPDWETLCVRQHLHHPFFAALRAQESDSGAWRRLRCFWRDEHPMTAPATPIFDDLQARAVETKGLGKELWRQRLNILGELFVKRPGEGFHFTLQRYSNGKIVLISTELGTPDVKPAPSAELRWGPAPSKGAPDEQAVSVCMPYGDPTKLEGNDLLYLGLEDHRGRTVDPRNKEVIFPNGEYVRPLQLLLQELGIAYPNHQDDKRPGINPGRFDRITSWAVRDFQGYAGMATVAQSTIAHELRPGQVYADSLGEKRNEQPYTGPITGWVDAATARALAYWNANKLRCPVVVEIRPEANPDFSKPAPVQNAWLPWQAQPSGMRVYVKDLTRHYALPPGKGGDARIAAGLSTAQGFMSEWNGNKAESTCWDEAAITPMSLLGRDLPAEADATTEEDKDAISTFKVIAAVANAETWGFFDSVNAWDGGIASVGAFHWKAYATTGNHGAEMPGLLALLASRDAPLFQHLFGRFGISIENTWPERDPEKSRMYRAGGVWETRVMLRGLEVNGHLDRELMVALENKADAEYLRTCHWFYRWVMAGRTTGPTANFRRIQWDLARLRLRALLAVRWQPGGPRLGEIFSSERAVCTLLRSHVNVPATIMHGNYTSEEIKTALKGAGLLNAESNALKSPPAEWTQTQVDKLHEVFERTMKEKYPKTIGETLPRVLKDSYLGKPLSEDKGSFRRFFTDLP